MNEKKKRVGFNGRQRWAKDSRFSRGIGHDPHRYWFKKEKKKAESFILFLIFFTGRLRWRRRPLDY